MSDGLHNHAGIWPPLPGREIDESAAAMLARIPEDDPWRTCWEFKLSHDLTDGEASAFWHGANLAYAAFTRPAAPPRPTDPNEMSEQSAEWRISEARDGQPWPCVIVDRSGKSLLAVHSGTPIIRDRPLTERILAALNGGGMAESDALPDNCDPGRRQVMAPIVADAENGAVQA